VSALEEAQRIELVMLLDEHRSEAAKRLFVARNRGAYIR
jgi:hypothetical protein